MNKFVYGGILIAMVIAIGGYFFPQVQGVVKLGAVDTNCQGFTSCVNDLYATTVSGGSGAIRAAGTLIVDGASTLTGAVSFTGLATFNGGELYTKTNATTTSVSTVLAASDLSGYDTVLLTPIVGSITITFPASSTVPTFLPTAGNIQKTCFENSTTTAAINITFASGTGFDLQVASSSATAVGSTILAPKKVGCFTFMRGASTASTFDIHAAYTAFK